MDIYLGYICSFCITTGTGYDAIPSFIFRKPVLFTNSVPLSIIPSYKKTPYQYQRNIIL